MSTYIYLHIHICIRILIYVYIYCYRYRYISQPPCHPLPSCDNLHHNYSRTPGRFQSRTPQNMRPCIPCI